MTSEVRLKKIQKNKIGHKKLKKSKPGVRGTLDPLVRPLVDCIPFGDGGGGVPPCRGGGQVLPRQQNDRHV